MDAGRLALLRRGTSEVGPYQSPMEDGMRHFHEWYRLAMEMAAGHDSRPGVHVSGALGGGSGR
jgi:hypothetical protein